MKRIFRAYKKTVSIVNETAISLFEGLAKDKKGFLLESYDKNNGRYTFLGADPEEIITSKKNNLVIQKNDGTQTILEGNPVEELKKYYSNFEVRTDGADIPFCGGLFGSLGYDYIRYIEELPDENSDEIGIETIQFMLALSFMVLDHVAETLTAIVLEEDSEAGKAVGLKKAEELIQRAVTNMVIREDRFEQDGVIIKKSDTLDQYSEKVEKIKHYIREGHIFQTVLSQRWTIETKQTGFDLYRQLRVLNPSPYLYYFNFGEFEIIGSSPEMLVKQVDQKVYTCPIAGSRRRGKDAKEDEFLKQDLLKDEKERAEHVMLVDLARNDMGRIAEFGSVKVTQFMEVQNYSHVMHIVSLVEGKKKGEYHPLDLVSSFLPAGTLSGAPKIRAMEIIDELETARRGLYGGATGYLDFNGNMDFCITIRTMLKKKNKVYLQAGAGIVADSVPKSEYEECCNKVMALAKTLVKEEQL
ncbi:anthranilate synthase component I [Candidatus Galacturonibacter soehngenii]|uniref:Anthranilate synthase component 1 n=1 Tax=Candidatus Galacturonatibacter soehngenii TaxID=2307010 RepID=A0A7V7UB20_9FIRM|nr:anthranilate synthase component I [Candidatus Galacturonibacter soehngenii]KAB1437540.1 anthranilate synthase component I [Candidatus Galacturonibacter soehngenii]